MDAPFWLLTLGIVFLVIFCKFLLILCRHKKLGVPLRWEKDFDERSAKFIEDYKKNWRTDLEEWKERNPRKKILLAIPIISSIVEIADLFSSDPFPVIWFFEEE